MEKGPERPSRYGRYDSNLRGYLKRDEQLRYVDSGIDWREVRQDPLLPSKPVVQEPNMRETDAAKNREPDGMISVGGMDVPTFKGEAIVGSRGIIFDGEQRVTEIE